MASCTVVSAFGALLRVFYVAFGTLTWDWRPALWVVAILTMVVGAVIAITQTDVKRLLAYSSIAHAGFILTAVIASSVQGLSSSLFYLATYGLTTIGAFAVITLVRDPGGEADHLSRWAGLGKRSPVVAGRLRAVPAHVRRHPADVTGSSGKFAVFSGGDRGRRDAARHRRRGGLGDRGVLLRPRDRADVLQRPGARRPRGGRAFGVHRDRGGASARCRPWCSASCPTPLLSLANHAATQLFVR